MKKVSLILVIVLAVLMAFSGCGTGGGTDGSGSAQAQSAENENGGNDGSGSDGNAADQAILVVSFGTSYNDSREKAIGAIENAIQEAFPDYDVRRAFTSQIIIDKLATERRPTESGH